MKEIYIRYKNKEKTKSYSQRIKLSDDAAKKLAKEITSFRGGEIEEDTYIYNLLTACTYLSRMEGFKSTPDFDLDPEDWMFVEEEKINCVH